MASEALLKVYPSGFLGNANVPQTAPMTVADHAKRIFDHTGLRTPTPYTANAGVVEIWAELLSADSSQRSFEFIERTLKVAIDAFGTQLLVPWIQAQLESPEYGKNHQLWLDETLMFVYEDKPRLTYHNGWRSLLTVGDNGKVSTYATDVLRRTVTEHWYVPRRNPTIKDFLVHWVRQPGGFRDLLESLNVLFGAR